MAKLNIYEMVTERIIEQLDNGIIPWLKPWTGTAGAWSRSTGKAYSLMNQWLMPRGEYATFNQIKKEGGKVTKGEHGYPVVFFKPTVIEYEDEKTGETKQKTVPLLRYYTVFNIEEQTDLKIKHNKEDVASGVEPVEQLEEIKRGYLDREGIKFSEVEGDRAYYSPSLDEVVVPTKEQFNEVAEYYSTVFHELAHSTGHSTRLNRIKATAGFGSNDYGKEELVAEITSSAVLNEAGIETASSFRNSTAYIQNWRNAIKGDNKLVVHASTKAQKAFEMIMNIK